MRRPETPFDLFDMTRADLIEVLRDTNCQPPVMHSQSRRTLAEQAWRHRDHLPWSRLERRNAA